MSETPSSRRWSATYYDGVSAAPYAVRLRLSAQGLAFEFEDGRVVRWHYDEVRQTQGAERNEPVRLERRAALGEALVVDDPAFVAALKERAPHGRFRGALGPREGVVVAFVALVGVVLGAFGLYRWGIPAIADGVATVVPIAWEEKLGEYVSHSLVPEAKRCESKESIEAVERIVQALTAGTNTPYTFRVAVARDMTVNAFAAPGGYLVVNQGLLAKTRRPEELAGVLAHEIQHVEQRHSTRALLRQMSLQLILTAVTGDMGALGSVIGVAGELGTLGYARSDEEEADREGMKRVLAQRLDPKGMVAAYRMLDAERTEMPSVMKYLSTHPDTADRIRKLQAQAAGARYAPRALLPGVNWARVSGGCR